MNKSNCIVIHETCDKEETVDFFEFKIDQEITKRASKVYVIYSRNDNTNGVLEGAKILRDELPGGTFIEYESYGHFTESDLGKKEFSKLLQLVLE